jgi:hypothetical protein
MRYLITAEPKEPFTENWRKMIALEEERSRKGIHLYGDTARAKPILEWHFKLRRSSGLGIVSVIETDDECLVLKMLQDHSQYADVEVVPIVERNEYVKRMGIEPTSPGT